MLKRIIFDLDGTLIPWKDEYAKGFEQAVKEFNLPIDITRENEMYTSFEKSYSAYTMENIKEHLEKFFEMPISEEFINTWLDYLGNMSEEIPEINETLAYLKGKYELVVLTNGFKESQEKRLAKARMREYFIEVYGGDKYMKPDPRSFELAKGPHLPEECLMVGDSLANDIEPAKKLGFQVFYLRKSEDNTKYDFPTITDIQSLKRIL